VKRVWAALEELNTEYYRAKLKMGVPSGYILTFAFSTLGILFGALGFIENPLPVVLVLAGIKLLTNTAMWLAIRSRHYIVETASLNLFADVIVLTGAVYLTGGPSSPVIAGYLVVLPLIGMFTNVAVTILTAVLMTVSYAIMVVMIHVGALKLYPTFMQHVYEPSQFTWAFVATDILKMSVLLATLVVASASVLREVKAQRQTLEEKNRELAEANRLKGEFIANVTHELRTPIHGVLGLSEMLEDEIYGEINARQREALDGIRTCAGGLLHMVDDLLSLERVSSANVSLKLGVVHLEGLVEELLEFATWVRGKKNVKLEARCEPGLRLMASDRTMVKHIVTNLLANALKFTPEGGSVELTVEQRGRHAVIRVRDTGVGIPADKLQLIFEPFRQIDGSASRSYGGTGLGLAVVKRLLSLLDGQVMVSSEVGKGSTFTVLLDGCIKA
jgi:signal transduction histidine kinase